MRDKDWLKIFLFISITTLFYGIFKPESYGMLAVVMLGSISLNMASLLIINHTWKDEEKEK